MNETILLEMRKHKTSHIFHCLMCILLGFLLGAVGVIGWLAVWFLCVLSNMFENWKLDRKINKLLAAGK